MDYFFQLTCSHLGTMPTVGTPSCERWIKEMLTENGVGKQRCARGALTHTPLILTHFTYPSGKKPTFNTPERSKIFSLLSNNSANEKPPQPQTPALLPWTSAQNRPSQLPPFLYKSSLLSFVLWICLQFTIVCLSHTVTPGLFLDKPICSLITSAVYFLRLTLAKAELSKQIMICMEDKTKIPSKFLTHENTKNQSRHYRLGLKKNA